MSQSRVQLKPQERLKIITDYIKTGKAKDGYKITETVDGKYRVSVIKTERDILLKQRAKLAKKIAEIDAQINANETE